MDADSSSKGTKSCIKAEEYSNDVDQDSLHILYKAD